MIMLDMANGCFMGSTPNGNLEKESRLNNVRINFNLVILIIMIIIILI
jgi:hypothetical protein